MDLLDLLPFLREQPEYIQWLVIDIVPFLAAFLLILILRWLLTWILLRPLRGLVARSSSDIDDRLLEASVSPLRLAVVGFSLILVTLVFSFDAQVKNIAVTIGRALLISAVFFGIVRWFEVLSLRPEAFARVTGWSIPERLLPFLNTVLKWLIIALGAIFVLQELNFDVAALIASLGVVGIGISLASQNTVSNMFGFAAIVSDNPFKVGDFIRTPDITGIVENVGVRSTRVRQLDQALITVPNNALTDAVVVNLSRMEKRRLDVTLTFTYSTTAQQMQDVVQRIRELLMNTEDIDPETVIVHFVDFNASSLDVRAICQVLLPDFREFIAKKETVFLDIMAIVESLGIDFAFPSRSLYIESTPDSAAGQAQAESAAADGDSPPDEDELHQVVVDFGQPGESVAGKRQADGVAVDRDSSSDEDELYQQAVDMVRQLEKASISLLQRRLQIGYTRAARMMDMMEERGVVGPPKVGSSKPRDVLPH